MFKLVSEKEETILKREFNKWSIFDVYKDLEIVIKIFKEKDPKYLEGKSDKVLIEKNNLKNRNRDTLKDKIKLINKKFIPNLNFAEIIVKYNSTLNYPYVILENKRANLVLYGRDIMGKSILEFNNQIKENQILLILNQKKEVIGIGRSRYNNKLIEQTDKITIDNIQDIGTHYLKYENKHNLKI